MMRKYGVSTQKNMVPKVHTATAVFTNVTVSYARNVARKSSMKYPATNTTVTQLPMIPRNSVEQFSVV